MKALTENGSSNLEKGARAMQKGEELLLTRDQYELSVSRVP